jgi:hypothetical protein
MPFGRHFYPKRLCYHATHFENPSAQCGNQCTVNGDQGKCPWFSKHSNWGWQLGCLHQGHHADTSQTLCRQHAGAPGRHVQVLLHLPLPTCEPYNDCANVNIRRLGSNGKMWQLAYTEVWSLTATLPLSVCGHLPAVSTGAPGTCAGGGSPFRRR